MCWHEQCLLYRPMSQGTEPPRSIDELVDRLLMVVVDLGWTPPGWRPDVDADQDGCGRPHHAWLLERLGDLAYLLAQHAGEEDPTAALDSSELPPAQPPLN